MSKYLGRYFHTWERDEDDREMIQYQGVVIADEPQLERLVVQLFSFWDGAESGEPMTVSYRQFLEAQRWTWYATSKEMRDVYQREVDYRGTKVGRHYTASLY